MLGLPQHDKGCGDSGGEGTNQRPKKIPARMVRAGMNFFWISSPLPAGPAVKKRLLVEAGRFGLRLNRGAGDGGVLVEFRTRLLRRGDRGGRRGGASTAADRRREDQHFHPAVLRL